jgi:hypothetical protein
MTIEEFLTELSKTTGWRLTKQGYIRRPHRRCPSCQRRHLQCPLIAVAGACHDSVIGARLGMPRVTMLEIVTAADHPNLVYSDLQHVREQLLKACELV